MPSLLARFSGFTRGTAPARCLAALSALVCIGSASAADLPTIRVGWTIPNEETKYLMMKRPELFPDLGTKYQVDWKQLQGTSPMVQGMLAGALDCATLAPIPMAQGAERNGLKAYIVAQHSEESPGNFSIYWGVREDSPIRSAADLKGKTIATNAIGSGVYYNLLLWLKKQNLDPEKDVRIVEVSFAAMDTAVRTGKVDAAPFVQPFAGRAQDAGGIRKLFSLSEVQSPLVHIFEGCEKGFSDKNPELVRLYIRDLTKAMDILKKDRSLAVDVNVEVMRAPRPALDRYVFTDQDMGHTDGSAPRLDVIAQSFALYREAGFITKPLSIDDFVRRDLLAPIR